MAMKSWPQLRQMNLILIIAEISILAYVLDEPTPEV